MAKYDVTNAALIDADPATVYRALVAPFVDIAKLHSRSIHAGFKALNRPVNETKRGRGGDAEQETA
jgi:hypothetical protein